MNKNTKNTLTGVFVGFTVASFIEYRKRMKVVRAARKYMEGAELNLQAYNEFVKLASQGQFEEGLRVYREAGQFYDIMKNEF